MVPHVSRAARVVLPSLVVAAGLLAGCAADVASEQDVGGSSAALTVCPAGDTLEGIDVSRWQGDIDWSQVAASGKAFAIARIGDGYYEDPTFDAHWAAIRDSGMVRGSYQFFRPTLDSAAQADIVIQHLGTLGPGDLPPVLDVESTPGDPLPSPSVMVAQIRAWMDHVQMALGVTPMIYTGPSFWDGHVASGMFGDNPLWVAHWGVTCPRMPTGWTDFRIHQYSDMGMVPGISGSAVDLDVFNGDQAALDTFAGGMACMPHCEGNTLVAADCMTSDCGMFDSTCTDDAVGVRCVSQLCPPEGSADVCASYTEIGHCQDGMLGSSTDCAAMEMRCTSDGGVAQCTEDPGVELRTPSPGAMTRAGGGGGCGCVVAAGGRHDGRGAAWLDGLAGLVGILFRRRRRR